MTPVITKMTELPAADRWTPSRSINRFQLLNRIEEGTYGIVYKAQDKETGELVAIKQLKLDREREGFPTTSLREISSLLSLKHRNIINLREVVVGDKLNMIYLVMDYVEHDLRSLLESVHSGPFFQLSEIKTIVLHVLQAISFMHNHWVVHRDLKLSNLLLGNDGIVKVADFGLARRIGDPLSGNLTEVVVTLWYRAPELLLGSTSYGPAVDIWSIGCILGELLLGRPLFPGSGEIDQVDKIISILGRPNPNIWPDMMKLPHSRKLPIDGNPYNLLDKVFEGTSSNGIDLLDRLLTFDPEKRITAEQAIAHPFFSEDPLPKDPSAFPNWPARSPVK